MVTAEVSALRYNVAYTYGMSRVSPAGIRIVYVPETKPASIKLVLSRLEISNLYGVPTSTGTDKASTVVPID